MVQRAAPRRAKRNWGRDLGGENEICSRLPQHERRKKKRKKKRKKTKLRLATDSEKKNHGIEKEEVSLKRGQNISDTI